MDRWLIGIVDRCIAKKLEDRFANVQQVLAALERRHIARLRRPLMLLGIVGPILLLAVTGLFAWRGAMLAANESSDQLREGALERNLFAAKFAARTLEGEMASLFKLIEEDTRKNELESRFLGCVDEAGDDLLHSLATDRTPPESQSRLGALASRIKLEEYLEERLSEIRSQIGSSQKPTRFDSMFVTDRFGTMLAGAFTSDRIANPIGANVAYRSYFSGQTRDLDEKTPPRNIPRTTSSQVSVPFKSKTTNRNKIAVSTPISVTREKDVTDNTSNEPEIVEGLLVLTINVGDFELLSNDDEKDPSSESQNHENRFAVLVDGHEGTGEGAGTREGTLLQHPIFRRSSIEGTARDEQDQFQIDEDTLKTLQEKGMLDYIDPVSQDARGKEFAGKWIAAMQRVDISRRVSESRERKQSTDLWVLVQEKADSITAPVESMVTKLKREGLIALLSLLTVVSMLWVVVLWVMRLPDSFSSIARTGTGNRNDVSSTSNEASVDGLF